MEFIPSFTPEENAEKRYLVLAEKEKYIVLDADGNPFLETPPGNGEALEIYLGLLEGRNLFLLSFGERDPLTEGLAWTEFYTAFRDMDHGIQGPVSRGKQLAEWRRSHRFCGSCGSPTEVSRKENVLTCPACGNLNYPVISPAVITRITRGDEILLAHNVNFPEGRYSHIAGFIEPGESVEDAIRREVAEEVGLHVDNIRFFSSQPWPMPHSLMLAFTAECVDPGDPVPDGVEIDDARWFTRETMPDLPGSGSIAGRMLQDYLQKP
jgi:NAD+ diphosphatase